MPQVNMPYFGVDSAYDVDEGLDELKPTVCRPDLGVTEMRQASNGAMKADIGKPPLSLIDPEFSRSMAHVLRAGEKKYGDKNWMQGLHYSWLIDSAKRHIEEFAEGKAIDEESGQPPLANAACCMMMLCWYERNGFGREFDDRRFKKVSVDVTDSKSKEQNSL